ncbi:MAG: divergent polysaccharide deacetylase family protein [Pseudomonadota bacterium]
MNDGQEPGRDVLSHGGGPTDIVETYRRQRGTRKKRLRAPVISRLTIAWAILAVLMAGSGFYLLSGNAPDRYALSIGEAERLSSTNAENNDPTGQEETVRLGAPNEPIDPDGIRVSSLDAVGAPAPKYPNDDQQTSPANNDANAPPDSSYTEEQSPKPLASLSQPSARIITIDGAKPNPQDKRFKAVAPIRASGERVVGFTSGTDDIGELAITIDGKPAPSREEAIRERDKALFLGKAEPIPDANPLLQRKTAYGFAPKKGPQGISPASTYAHRFQNTVSSEVSLIVSGLGIDPDLTATAIDTLPSEITLSFAPYGKDLPYWTERARKAGHEILVEVPMEQGADVSLGSAALTTGRAPQDNLKRLDWVLSRFGAYVGVTNHMGMKFVSNRTALRRPIDAILTSGLLVFDDTGRIGPTVPSAKNQISSVSMLITPQTKDLERALSRLEATAKRDGIAVGKIYVTAQSIETLREWLKEFPAKDLTPAPASAVFSVESRKTAGTIPNGL